ncbi:MAG: Lrp/AsnC family transcriptional regulator [Actinobacteria bacterium]|nr:Lrp/AsnC family transcriptional regulator [Actinomycetota bacterium]
MNAYVLITTDAGKVMDVLTAIKAIEGVKSAHSIIGPYDIIAFIEFTDPAGLTSLIVDKIQKVSGISRTLTCIAGE